MTRMDTRSWAQARFAAFCEGTGRDPLLADPYDVVAWLESEQPGGRTAARWTAGISQAWTAAGLNDPCTGPVKTWVRRARHPGTRRGIDESEVAARAGRLPVSGWPAGLRGRRNRLAFILRHLADIPVAELVTLRAVDLTVPGHGTVTIGRAGGPVTVRAGHPAACPACAAVRWAWVLQRAAALNTTALEHGLRRAPPAPDAHVCVPLNEAGPAEWPLFPKITKQGHFDLPPVPPLSIRSMEKLLRDTLAGTGTYRQAARREPPPARMPAPPPVPAPADPDWYRRGVAARNRDRERLAAASSVLDDLDAAITQAENLTRQAVNDAGAEDGL